MASMEGQMILYCRLHKRMHHYSNLSDILLHLFLLLLQLLFFLVEDHPVVLVVVLVPTTLEQLFEQVAHS